MISILNELTLEIGDAATEEEVTLWLVNYGEQPSRTTIKRTHTFIEALARWCLTQGWLLETGCGDSFALPEMKAEFRG